MSRAYSFNPPHLNPSKEDIARIPYYPGFLRESNGSLHDEKITFFTKVRIFREEKWYFVVHTQSYFPSRKFVADANPITDFDVIKHMIFEIRNTQLFWQLSGMEHLDPCQESEEERIKKLMP